MKINNIVVGELETNCYILSKDNKSIIIDPGDNFDLIDKNIEGELIGVIITHHHYDHIGALEDIISKYNPLLFDAHNLEEGVNTIKNFSFEVIKTPGHTTDSISVYFSNESVIFTGDFIFYHSIGRMDLPTGDLLDMINSIKKIKKYPKDTIIFPGHGCKTTLGEELNYLDTYL